MPFVQNEDLLSTGKQWEEWIEGIEFRYFRITEPVDKKDALLIYGGKEIVRLNKSLTNERAEELDEFAVLKNKLDKYFLPKKNKHHARYTFLRMKQERGEKNW